MRGSRVGPGDPDLTTVYSVLSPLLSHRLQGVRPYPHLTAHSHKSALRPRAGTYEDGYPAVRKTTTQMGRETVDARDQAGFGTSAASGTGNDDR